LKRFTIKDVIKRLTHRRTDTIIAGSCWMELVHRQKKADSCVFTVGYNTTRKA